MFNALSWIGAQPQRVVAHGSVGCLSVQKRFPNVQCSGDDFVMNCAIEGADDWITCRGGNNAIVYIF